jgi:DNA primase
MLVSQHGGYGEDRARVLDASDIVRLISEHITLRRKGSEFVGLCPFHDDHSPSMYVSPRKQIYKCFSCGAGGNVIDFVVNYHRMDFREALAYLADRFGVQLATPSRQEAPARSTEPEITRQDLLNAAATAQAFFRVILSHAEHGAAAREVLRGRGVSLEMVERFALGAAPDKWDGLVLTVQSKGLDLRHFLAAGLARPREHTGGAFDMFRNRIIFPIHDMLGRVVAFGARRIDETDEPKYINSPESKIFQKSRALYGLPQARDAILKSGRVVITEGYMDAIACHQAGITNVVATLGTALTTEHSRVLERLCSEAVLLFDGDEAGQRAADRAVEVLFSSRLEVRIATLSSIPGSAGAGGAKDPDDLLKQPGGAEALRGVIDRAVDALEFRFQKLGDRTARLGITARATRIQEELERLADLGWDNLTPLRQNLIIRRLASIAGVTDQVIRRSIPSTRQRRPSTPRVADSSGAGVPEGTLKETARTEPATGGHRLRTSREHVLACILSEPGLWSSLDQAGRAMLAPGTWDHVRLRVMAESVFEYLGRTATPSKVRSRDLIAGIADDDARSVAVAFVAELDRLTESDPVRTMKHFQECLADAARRWATAEARGASGTEADEGSVLSGPGVSNDQSQSLIRIARLRDLSRSGGKDPRTVPRPRVAGP